jgi:hypothetical protein
MESKTMAEITDEEREKQKQAMNIIAVLLLLWVLFQFITLIMW